MLNIAICEEERKEADRLRNALEDILGQRIDVRVVIYKDSDAVKNDIDKGHFPYEIIFLELHKDEEAAQYIREKRLDADIICFSRTWEHMFEGCCFRTYAYLHKPLDIDELEKLLEQYLEEKETFSACLNVSIYGNCVKIPLKDVMYFSSQGRRVHAVMADASRVTFYDKMDAVYAAVESEGFVRCHQSHIVNLAYIHSHNQDAIVMKNGQRIVISRAFQRIVRDVLESSGDAPEKGTSLRITRSLTRNREGQGSLVFLNGEHAGQIIRIEQGGVIRIGTNPDSCAVVYEAEDIAPEHCTVRYDMNGVYYVKDISGQGSYVKGRQLNAGREYRLPVQSVLVLGESGQEILLG